VAENTEPLAITWADGTWIVATSDGPVESDALVVTAGLGTNDVPGLVPGCTVRFPLRPDRPTQSKYYNPPDVARTPSQIDSVEKFVAECMPGLRDAEVVDVAAASGVDTCWYDLVSDDEFILGAVPGAPGLYTGVGWRGTGYKFAPWVGRVLAQLALQQGTVYDIGRFTPARFAAAEAPEGAAR
jgi:glycine/D-amino acid oxidase-like deaminating enzyme